MSASPNIIARLETDCVTLSTDIGSLYTNQWFWASTLALSTIVRESAIKPLIAQAEREGEVGGKDGQREGRKRQSGREEGRLKEGEREGEREERKMNGQREGGKDGMSEGERRMRREVHLKSFIGVTYQLSG